MRSNPPHDSMTRIGNPRCDIGHSSAAKTELRGATPLLPWADVQDARRMDGVSCVASLDGLDGSLLGLPALVGLSGV